MSVILKKDTWKIKDPNTGEYRDSTVFASTFAEDTADIVAEATAAIDAQETRAAGIVSGAQADIDTIAAAVQSMTQTGTDTTLTVSGSAADSKTVGDNFTNLNNIIEEYLKEDSISSPATYIKTISNATVSTTNNVIVEYTNCSTVIFDVKSAPIIVCNGTRNRFVFMFIDTPDATIGTQRATGTRLTSCGNNPTIDNLIIANPARARYAAIWYANSLTDFNGTLTLLNTNLSFINKNSRIAGINDKLVRFETPQGVGSSYSPITNPCLYEVFENSVWVNGTVGSSILRIMLYGNVSLSTTTAPSYSNYSSIYYDPIDSFIVGHKYGIKIDIVSGEYSSTNGSPYLDMRDSSDNNVMFNDSSTTLGNIYTWECTFSPEMICMGVRAGTYTNAVFRYTIIDLTLYPSTSIEAKYLLEQIGNYIVPTYFDSQLLTAISKINTDINSNKTSGTYGTDIESFVFITDPHWNQNQKHSPALIRKLFNNCPLSTIICGGDIIYSYNATKEGAVEEIKSFTDAMVGIPCYDYFAVWGNHDNNTNSNAEAIATHFTRQESYNVMCAPFANKNNVHWSWEDSAIYEDDFIKLDFYVDHAFTRTRYLCIDWQHPYTDARSAWINSVLEKDDGFRVVVIYHGIYSGSTGSIEPEHIQLMSILEPYKAKVVAVFCGHAHLDTVVDYYGDGSVPVILTSCDKLTDYAHIGTIDEQCFDVVVIDYKQSKIKLTRIGRGSDRTVNISVTAPEMDVHAIDSLSYEVVS